MRIMTPWFVPNYRAVGKLGKALTVLETSRICARETLMKSLMPVLGCIVLVAVANLAPPTLRSDTRRAPFK
jgi:hypothetical protein